MISLRSSSALSIYGLIYLREGFISLLVLECYNQNVLCYCMIKLFFEKFAVLERSLTNQTFEKRLYGTIRNDFNRTKTRYYRKSRHQTFLHQPKPIIKNCTNFMDECEQLPLQIGPRLLPSIKRFNHTFPSNKNALLRYVFVRWKRFTIIV